MPPRETICRDNADRLDFIWTFAAACQKNLEVHAYCLMDNHFHLRVETPGANPVAGTRWRLNAYTSSPRGSSARAATRRNGGSGRDQAGRRWRASPACGEWRMTSADVVRLRQQREPGNLL